MDDQLTRLALSCCLEPGNARFAGLIDQWGTDRLWSELKVGRFGEVLRARADRVDAPTLLRQASRLGLRYITPGSDEWPDQLEVLARCEPVQDMMGIPLGLWVRGELPLGETVATSISIVGSRASTPYGESVATELAADLGSKGVATVSGGAYGIDIAAHRGALAAGAPTVSVMASGLDSLYPPGNAALLQRIGVEGLLVSELPPGEHPTRSRFLARNRLIAALSVGTVMVEAAARSGARNTVTWAGACGRLVMAVPGPITSGTSETPHRLIRDGEAVLVTCADDVLELVGPLGRPPRSRGSQRRPLDGLSAGELAVFEALPATRSLGAGELALRTGLSLPECLAWLESLLSRGLVRESGAGWSVVRQPSNAFDP